MGVDHKDQCLDRLVYVIKNYETVMSCHVMSRQTYVRFTRFSIEGVLNLDREILINLKNNWELNTMNKQSGFTLIEIVMVLVLLGILSAVAVPKYFDLQKQAEVKSALAVAAEVQARLNGKFASELLNGTACATARSNAITEAKATSVTNGTVSFSTEPGATDEKVAISVTINGNVHTTTDGKTASDSNKIYVVIPKCN